MQTVTIIYKSGAKVKIKCKEMTIRKRGGTLTEVKWIEADPRPMLVGVDDIAAIYEGTA